MKHDINSFEKLVARVNMSAFLPDDKETHHPEGKGKRPKVRLLAAAEKLDAQQVEQLLHLLKGEAVLAVIGGNPYSVERSTLGWLVCGTEHQAEKHTVNEEATECSCEDSRFRRNQCKHIQAVRRNMR